MNQCEGEVTEFVYSEERSAGLCVALSQHGIKSRLPKKHRHKYTPNKRADTRFCCFVCQPAPAWVLNMRVALRLLVLDRACFLVVDDICSSVIFPSILILSESESQS
jgi:hypothetical protein